MNNNSINGYSVEYSNIFRMRAIGLRAEIIVNKERSCKVYIDFLYNPKIPGKNFSKEQMKMILEKETKKIIKSGNFTCEQLIEIKG